MHLTGRSLKKKEAQCKKGNMSKRNEFQSSPQGIENLRSIADYLNIALRYIASGFICMLLYIYLFSYNASYTGNQIAQHETILLSIAAVLGFLIYAIHRAYIDRVFYKWSISRYLFRNGIPEKVINKWKMENTILNALKFRIISLRKLRCAITHSFINNGKDAINKNYTNKVYEAEESHCPYCNARDIIELMFFELYTQGYYREASKSKRINILNKKLDDRYAMLAFLYCSAYSCILFSSSYIIVSLYKKAHYYLCLDNISNPFIKSIKGTNIWDFDRALFVFLSGIILFIICQKYSYRLLKRDIWIMDRYWQNEP